MTLLMWTGLLLLAAAVAVGRGGDDFSLPKPWENNYGWWRHRDTVPLDVWADRFPVPLARDPPVPVYEALSEDERHSRFITCLEEEAVELTQRTMGYRPPKLADVATKVRAELDARGMGVTLSVFWGRMRYVNILQHYIKRNLRVNGGVLDHVVLVTFARVPGERGWGAC